MNLTIVSVPFPFNDNKLTIVHQHNAIKSWLLLDPRPEILLIGDEYGIADVATQYGVRHAGGVKRNKLGDLSMASIFKRINENVDTDWIAYLDCDTILFDDFVHTFEYCSGRWDNCMICAGRWDAKIPNAIDFSSPNWRQKVLDAVYKLGKKGSDWFVYRKGFYQHIPDCSIGKGAWDGWMIAAALKQGFPVINAEKTCKAVHQQHGMRWSNNPAAGRNKRLCGDTRWIKDSSFFITPKDLKGA